MARSSGLVGRQRPDAFYGWKVKFPFVVIPLHAVAMPVLKMETGVAGFGTEWLGMIPSL